MSLQGTSTLVTSLAGGRELALAEQGGQYTAITPTPGTGIIAGAVQTFVETTPVLVVYNGGLLNIFPQYLRMHCTVISTTASTAKFWTNTLDVGNRYTSGGTALTINNTNMASNASSGAVITFGAITATAATSARRVVSHSASKYVTVETVHDTISLNWGDPATGLLSNLINNAASLVHSTNNHAPVMIGPGQSMVLVHWGSAVTVGVTLEAEFAFVAK